MRLTPREERLRAGEGGEPARGVQPDPFSVLATGDRVRMSPRRGVVERLPR